MATSQPTISAFHTPQSQEEIDLYILNLGRERPIPRQMRAHELDGFRRSKFREAVVNTLKSTGELCVRSEGDFMILHTWPETRLSVAEFNDIVYSRTPEKVVDDFYTYGTAAYHLASHRLRRQKQSMSKGRVRQARSSPLCKGDSGATKRFREGGNCRPLSMPVRPKQTGRYDKR